MASALTVKDVDTHKFIVAYAEHLKRSGKIELPKVRFTHAAACAGPSLQTGRAAVALHSGWST